MLVKNESQADPLDFTELVSNLYVKSRVKVHGSPHFYFILLIKKFSTNLGKFPNKKEQSRHTISEHKQINTC